MEVSVKFYDIGGVLYNQLFEAVAEFNYSTTENEQTTLYGQLTFTKKRYGKTKEVLTRLRKSYADFMNEYDFNKNNRL